MPSLTLPDRLIWFAHCPKAGGTTVEKFMVSQWGDAVGHLHWGWDLWWKKGGWRVANPPNSPQHLIWKDAVATLPCRPDMVFAVVRDPIARMQSEYRWQRRLRRGTRLGRGLTYLPFSLWLRIMLELARQNPHAFDNHFQPQAAFIPERAKVFALEDGLDPVLQWLAAQGGNKAETGAVLPLAKKSNATGHTRPVTCRDAARIAAAFADDYARFGYAQQPTIDARSPCADAFARFLAPMLAWLDRRGCL